MRMSFCFALLKCLYDVYNNENLICVVFFIYKNDFYFTREVENLYSYISYILLAKRLA